MQVSAEKIWGSAQEQLRSMLSADTYNLWFAPLRALGLLGLQAPWHIARVALDTSGEWVDLWVEHDVAVRWACPDCEAQAPGHDHAEERVWRHLDTCQYQTFLHARVPRVQCSTHGVRQVRVPWAKARSRFTLLLAGDRSDPAVQHGDRRVPHCAYQLG
jgi:hypothetical protein